MYGPHTRERSTGIKLTEAANHRLGSIRDRPSCRTDAGHSRKTVHSSSRALGRAAILAASGGVKIGLMTVSAQAYLGRS